MPRDDAAADWLYAGDAASAAWLALTADRLSYRVYNVGSERRPVGEFTEAMRRVLPGVTVASSSTEQPGHPHAAMDFSRLRDDLGFVPRYGFDEGIADYVDRVRAYDAHSLESVVR
jgi:nucleoside-diphosphate-sugar epimerase